MRTLSPACQVLGGAAAAIVSGIVGVIKLKRHIKGRPFQEKIGAVNNTIEVINSENVTISMPITVYNVYKSKLIDQDISKIVRPLEKGKIEAAEIHIPSSPNTKPVFERIEAAERDLFLTESVSVTSTRESWIVGKLNSLTKSTNSGYLHLSDGSRVFYRFVGEDSSELRRIFGTYEGPVKVFATAELDENLKVVELRIESIQRAQGELFPHADFPGDDAE